MIVRLWWGPTARARRDAAYRLDQIDAAGARLAALVGRATVVSEHHQAALRTGLDQNLAALRHQAAHRYPLDLQSWTAPGWRAEGEGARWSPSQPGRPGPAAAPRITIGQLCEARSGAELAIPALVDLERNVVIVTRGGQREAGVSLLQSLLLRSALVLPPSTTFTMVDPAGESLGTLAGVDAPLGQTGAARSMPGVAQVVGVAGYPAGYGRRARARLGAVAGEGPTTGVLVLVHHHVEVGEEPDLLAFGDPLVVDLGDPPVRVTPPGRAPLDVTVAYDGAPPSAVRRQILDRLDAAARHVSVLRWDELSQPPEAQWWRGDATERVAAPIGVEEPGRCLEVFFGAHGDDGRPCAHGVVVAMTGAGKTALFHTLIAGLAVRYGPEELQLYLLDGKTGVGFAGYRGLPHAAVISLRTSPELARSLLDDLLAEMVRRNEIFKRHHVEHFAGYRGAGSPEGRLPRLLLIADEFQLLFEDDADARAAGALLRLTEQARSAGIHLLLGSQHFAPASMTHRNLIFANLHLRIALQVTASDARACGDFGADGRRLIEANCRRAGRAVVNDRAGDDAQNHPATVAYLDDDVRRALGAALRRRRPPGAGGAQIILDGDGQPDLGDNPLVEALVAIRSAGPQAQARARLGIDAGGLGIDDWTAVERPLALLLGRTFSLRGQAVALLRRRQHEHLCVVGEHHPERVATLAAAVLSACLQLPGPRLRLVISDRAGAGTPWAATLGDLAAGARHAGYEVELSGDDAGTEVSIEAVAAEVDRRSGWGEAEVLGAETMVVVLAEADRVGSLQRVADRYGYEDSELGARLGLVMDRGAALGVHLVAGFATLSSALAIMSQRRLQGGFRHRVAMQMSEDDSFAMVGSPVAARLQGHGPRPVGAVLFDRQGDRAQRFRPYTGRQGAPDAEELSVGERADAIFSRLAALQAR